MSHILYVYTYRGLIAHIKMAGNGLLKFPREKNIFFKRNVPSETDNIGHWYWVNFNDLTVTSLEMAVSRGDYPQMTLIQISEIL